MEKLLVLATRSQRSANDRYGAQNVTELFLHYRIHQTQLTANCFILILHLHFFQFFLLQSGSDFYTGERGVSMR